MHLKRSQSWALCRSTGTLERAFATFLQKRFDLRDTFYGIARLHIKKVVFHLTLPKFASSTETNVAFGLE